MKGKISKVLIIALVMAIVFASLTGCGGEQAQSAEKETAAEPVAAAPPVLAGEFTLCDVKIIEQMSSTGGAGGNTYYDTVVQYAYVDNNGVIQYETRPKNAVQLQPQAEGESKLVTYQGDGAVYLCLSPDLYCDLF